MSSVPSAFPLQAEYNQLRQRLIAVVRANESAYEDGYRAAERQFKSEGSAGFVIGLFVGVIVTCTLVALSVFFGG